MSSAQVEAVRGFNRFYTRQIGVLNQRQYDSPFSLTEVRVLYELAYRADLTAAELGKDLGLDAGYLSRLLGRFQKARLVTRKRSASDGRQSHLGLTAKGRSALEPLEDRARREVGVLLGGLSDDEQIRLVGAMHTIESLLNSEARPSAPYSIRHHRAGDMGWVVYRHGALYAQEYGWTEEFEGLIAEIVAKFLKQFDPARERCWIAERDGEILGSVFLVKESEDTGRLRLLLVEPKARGLGIGHRLVEECVRFAREAGYSRITLWTNDGLHAARRIYEQAGFRLTKEEPHHSFGYDLMGQHWDLVL